jgi:hypothetical protein
VFAWNYVTGSGYEFNAVDYMGKNTSSAYTFYAAGWGNEYGVWRIEKLGAQTSMVKVYNLRDFLDFKIDPANPTIALAGNWNGQLYKFENFAAVPTVTAVKAFGAPVYNIIFDPRANGKVLIAAINGTYRSVDYGATWSLVDASSPYRTEAVVEIEQSPWNEDEYFIAAIRQEEADVTSGLYVYNFVQDTLVQLGLVGDDTVDLACDYDSNTTLVYVLTRQGKVFVYDGASFVQKTTVPGTTGLRKIDIVNAPCLSKMLYVCGDTAATKVYRSSDLGNTWQQYSTGLPGGVNKLVFSDDFSIAMSAGNYSGTGVYIDETCQSFYTATSTFTPTATATKTDTPTATKTSTPIMTQQPYSCSTWQPYMQAGVAINAAAYLGENNGKSVIYTSSWGSDYGVYRIEYDNSSKVMTKVYDLRDFTDFVSKPGDNNVMFAGNWNGKIYRFENVMSVPTVTVLKQFTSGYIIVSLETDREGSGKMISANYTGIYRSPDYGINWELVDSGNSLNLESCWQVKQSPWNSDVYYIVATKFDSSDPKGGIYRYTWSTDTLELLGLESEDTSEIAFDRLSTAEKIYVACRDGKFYEYSSGLFTRKTNTQAAGVSGRNGISTVLCSGSQLIYEWSPAGLVHISTDSGSSWVAANSGLTNGVIKMHFNEARNIAMAMQASSQGGVYINGICCIPEVTVTNTPTATNTVTRTYTPVLNATFTPTYTSTVIHTATIAPEFTATQTPYDPVPRPTVEEGDSVPCPNVGKDSVKIVFNVNKKAQCRVYIYDFSGKLVDDYDITVGDTPNEKLYQLKIDTSKYVSGVYYYVIQGKDMEGNKIDFKSKKFMIKK